MTFRGYPFLTPSFERNTIRGCVKFFHKKLKNFVAFHSEDFVILACTILIRLQDVTYGPTDASAIAKTRHSITCCRV